MDGVFYVLYLYRKHKMADLIPLRTNFKILYGGMGQIRHIPTCLVLRGL